MSNKEEKEKECVKKIFEEQYNSHLDSDDIREAFNIGWNAAFKEAINYLEILMERNSLPLGLQKAIVKELKHFVMEE